MRWSQDVDYLFFRNNYPDFDKLKPKMSIRKGASKLQIQLYVFFSDKYKRQDSLPTHVNALGTPQTLPSSLRQPASGSAEGTWCPVSHPMRLALRTILKVWRPSACPRVCTSHDCNIMPLPELFLRRAVTHEDCTSRTEGGCLTRDLCHTVAQPRPRARDRQFLQCRVLPCV